jgi:hypothetical protein
MLPLWRIFNNIRPPQLAQMRGGACAGRLQIVPASFLSYSFKSLDLPAEAKQKRWPKGHPSKEANWEGKIREDARRADES